MTDDIISKSQRKRDCDAAQKLGEELIGLKPAELAGLELSNELLTAIQDAHKIKSNIALKRQRQYIGKLMRTQDTDTIANKLALIKHKNNADTAKFKMIEQWKNGLLGMTEGVDEKSVLSDLIDTFPELDRQHINQLVRQAKLESAKNKPPASARKLFKYLRLLYETKSA